eukprot:gene3803-4060_t
MSEQPSSFDMGSGRSLRRSSSSYQAAGSLRPSKVSSHRSSDADGEAASSIPAPHGEALQPEGLQLPSGDEDIGDPTRQFELTLDVRSFQAGRRLPLALASTYVQAFLPQELLGFLSTKCAAKLPPRLTPLRTLPAVDITRGSEGALPNGCVTVSFAAGVVSLAGLLAQEPKLTLEVWHKEKLRADLLLGVASVSLSALLQECWVDGYAPVYALMTKASAGSDAPMNQQEERVQHTILEKYEFYAWPESLADSVASTLLTVVLGVMQAEEVKFRAQLRELEQQRMAVLEAQWWKREQAREAELAAIKAEFVKLQQQTQAVLTAAQAREASVLSAEADLRRRQSDLERQQAARMTEAEAAVRRLQVECEHQLSVERDRTAAVARQRDDAEVRLLAAEARAAGLEVRLSVADEAQFTEYRAAQRNTSEAQLQAALDRATQAARLAQEKAAKALKAKRQYKQQVLQLARELAAHHEQRQAELLQELNRQQATALAQEQGRQVHRLASAAAAELSALRQQLQELKTVALQHGPPGAAAGSSRRANAARAFHAPMQYNTTRYNTSPFKPFPDLSPLILPQVDIQHERLIHHDPEGDQAERDTDSGSSTEDEVPPRNRQKHTQQARPAGPQSQAQAAVGGPQDLATAAAGADAALAEVAALAAVLNKPRRQRSSGLAAPDHQQDLQLQEPAGTGLTAAAVADPAVAAHHPPASRELAAVESWGNVGAAASHSAAAGPTSPAGGNPLSEVRRLLKEKVELLASGLYSRDDAVILQIDARVQHLAEQQLQQ